MGQKVSSEGQLTVDGEELVSGVRWQRAERLSIVDSRK